MSFFINSTEEYHRNQLNSLGWELTLCNALYPGNTPLRRLLKQNDSYGHLLYDFLQRFIPMDNIMKIIEIGGGYGYLMKDFLDRNSHILPCMLDISPFLLEKQKEILKGSQAWYVEADLLDIDSAFLEGYELAILNENLGDFPTLVDIKVEEIKSLQSSPDEHLMQLFYIFEKYDLFSDLSESKLLNVNIGAIKALEKLCKAGIAFIFLSEHSCEAQVPDYLSPFINILSSGNPERIALKGHDEYSLKFSYLEKIAGTFGYISSRGNFIDFIKINITDTIKYILSSQSRYNDEDEIVCHFIEDLCKYEYLILQKP